MASSHRAGMTDSAVIAAQPGYFVLNVSFGITPDDPPAVDKEPVVAWMVDAATRTLLPLCVNEALDGSYAEAWGILYPGWPSAGSGQ
jgi:hypothetical protein